MQICGFFETFQKHTVERNLQAQKLCLYKPIWRKNCKEIPETMALLLSTDFWRSSSQL